MDILFKGWGIVVWFCIARTSQSITVFLNVLPHLFPMCTCMVVHVCIQGACWRSEGKGQLQVLGCASHWAVSLSSLFKRLVCGHALAGLEFVTLQSLAGITEPHACKAGTTQYIVLPLHRERCISESLALLSPVQRTKGIRCFQECSKVARN